MANKPFLGTKNEKGEVVDCFCLDCKLMWKCWMKDLRNERRAECFKALSIPFDRFDLCPKDHIEGEEDPCYLIHYPMQQFVIFDLLDEFLEEKMKADELYLHFIDKFRYLKLAEKEFSSR